MTADIAIEAAKASGKLLLENKNHLNKETSSNSRDVELEADVSSENWIKRNNNLKF